MPVSSAAFKRLAAIPELVVLEDAPLFQYTRFGIGGPASILCDTTHEQAFVEAIQVAQDLALPRMVIGGGTNLVVSDTGFEGIVLRYAGARIARNGYMFRAEAGAILQDVVDRSIAWGLKGMETMTGIPGYLGGAVYGNAGAYGHSIQERIRQVRLFDGDRIVSFRNEDCQFRYRESVFKERKDWIILSADLEFESANTEELAKTAAEIRTIRDAKYPPMMKCAGSIFKNFLAVNLPAEVVAEIPAKVIREGKIPSAWFLEQAGGKGLRRGDIQVATYHANLIYNDGSGSAADLVSIIQELKQRVRDRFGIELEEEVQYVGFDYAAAPA
ncbi:MAG: UDP-N-acetylmuramate dehydrogenase [Acidobacteriaceae bacterium]|nr:UDP-N-acetylmuramate dehydrogenase [Acidobacteriaceae bacterium]